MTPNKKTTFCVRAGTVLMAFLLLLVALTSCKTGEEVPVSTDAPGTSETDTPPVDSGTEEERYRPADTRFDCDYKIVSYDRNQWGTNHFVPDGDLVDTTDPIDYALYVRDARMQEQYGVRLVFEKNANPQEQLANAVTSGLFFADAVYFKGYIATAAAQSGYLYNLLAMPELNLETSYWDQRIQNEYRIGEKLFCLEGDISVIDEMVTMVVLYNNQAYDIILDAIDYDEQYGSLYNMVDSREWTYEVMLAMASEFTRDSDGTEGMSATDHWGIVSETQMPYYFYLGSGQKTMKNENGELVLTILEPSQKQTVLSILQNLLKLSEDPNVLIADRDLLGSSDHWALASSIFENDRALFRTTSLSAAMRLKNMEGKFGILPIPLYESGQQEYYCWVSAEHVPLTIPSNVPDAQKTAQITEVMAYVSRYGSDSLYSAYFDELTITNFCKTAEDRRMLELVFASKTYDMDNATGIVDVRNLVVSLVKDKKTGTLTSSLDANLEKAEEELRELVLAVMNQAKT